MVVTKVCLRKWMVKSSASMPASSARRARMSLAPRTPSLPPRAFRNKAGLVSARGQPGRSSLIQMASWSRSSGCKGDLPVPAALAGADNDMALAGGEGDIAHVERNGLADAQPRVERHQRQHA